MILSAVAGGKNVTHLATSGIITHSAVFRCSLVIIVPQCTLDGDTDLVGDEFETDHEPLASDVTDDVELVT